MNNPIKIAVLGSGNIGGTLGAKWAAAGHIVAFGVRNPASVKAQSAQSQAGENARLTGFADAIQSSEVVVIATPSGTVDALLAEHGGLLNGKLVVDTTNRFGTPVINHLAEIAQAAPQARVHRAFNSLGWECFANPVVNGTQVDLFYCGPNDETHPVMEQLITDAGLRPVYVGGLETAAIVDNVGALWVTLVFQRKMPRHMALKLIQ
ncbi:MAG: NAD(P)-binding domain-containing protein [Anaerolineae bacterium]